MEALWKSITGLKSIQSSLQSFALEISRAEQTQDPAAVMKELRSKAEDISSTIHYDVTEEEKRGAKQAAEDTTLHKILQRFRSAHRSDEAVHDEDDRPIAAAADAGEIIAVTRRKA